MTRLRLTPPLLLFAALSAPLLARPRAAQDPTPAPEKPAPEKPAPETPKPQTPATGTADKAAPALPELAPGVLPGDATPQAIAAWNALSTALGVSADTPRVSAFDLSFEARVWQEGGEGEKTFKNGRLRFLAPNFVDSALDSGRRRLRGPRGDWLIDSKGSALKLQGVELQQDRRELDQITHVARTFANLVNTRALRVRKLELVAGLPFQLPAKAAERVAGAQWLALVSPDFAIARHDGSVGAREVRAWLALDPKDQLPALAVVAEDESGTLAPESALLIELVNWTTLDGQRAPKNVRTFAPDLDALAARGEWRFRERQTLQLWLTKGTLRAQLSPADFAPPNK